MTAKHALELTQQYYTENQEELISRVFNNISNTANMGYRSITLEPRVVLNQELCGKLEDLGFSIDGDVLSW